jgi:hypothetical protein
MQVAPATFLPHFSATLLTPTLLTPTFLAPVRVALALACGGPGTNLTLRIQRPTDIDTLTFARLMAPGCALPSSWTDAQSGMHSLGQGIWARSPKSTTPGRRNMHDPGGDGTKRQAGSTMARLTDGTQRNCLALLPALAPGVCRLPPPSPLPGALAG